MTNADNIYKVFGIRVEKAKGDDNSPPKKALDRTDFSGGRVSIDPKTGEKQYWGVKPKSEPGGKETSDWQSATFTDGKWRSNNPSFGRFPKKRSDKGLLGMEKALISLQKIRGPVDRMTGGRVKLETNPDKQVNPQKPLLGVPGIEVQAKVKRGGLADKASKKVGFQEITPKQKTEAAGLEYAPKMQKAEDPSDRYPRDRTGRPYSDPSVTGKRLASEPQVGVRGVQQRFTPKQKKEGGKQLPLNMSKAVISLQKFLDNDCGCDD